MRKIVFPLLAFALLAAAPAAADPTGQIRATGARGPRVILAPREVTAAIRPVRRERGYQPAGAPDFAPGAPVANGAPGSLGGGFIEFLVTGHSYDRNSSGLPRSDHLRPWQPMRGSSEPYRTAHLPFSREAPAVREAAPRQGFDPRFARTEIDFATEEKPGTIIIDTAQRYLYLVKDDGRAIRYGIGVGRPGFDWKGVKKVSAKREWPDWRPPKEMLERRPDLPVWMAGGPDNPLGARAIYLGSSLYRIHGSNEPHTIGQAVSSGCFRMKNDDVIDLYERVKVGTKVVVI
jgi:lipoprotein-anchoring transpeptidase ErfK/SrfK